MKNLTYLFAAFSLIWAGVFLYLVRLSSLRKHLEQRISRVEERLGDEGPTHG